MDTHHHRPAILLVFATSAVACAPDAQHIEHDLPVAAAPASTPARLAETGLYVAGSSSVVRLENLAFSPQYPLWTDGATKRRWIHLPAGTSIDASVPDSWRFPPGTRLWKEFSFDGRRVETRYMEALPDGSWRYATYLWLPDDSDAILVGDEGIRGGVAVEGPAPRHQIPSNGDCRACHEAQTTPVLGFSALQLSPDRDPAALHADALRPEELHLRKLVDRGLIRGLPDSLLAHPPRIDAPTATARAALGYLHGNCGHCHNSQGPLAPVGLVLAQSVAGPAPVLASALNRPSRFRPPGHPGAELRVAPGRPDLSVLAVRMHSRDPLIQMPPIGTLAVDREATSLVDRWITDDLAVNSNPLQRRAPHDDPRSDHRKRPDPDPHRVRIQGAADGIGGRSRRRDTGQADRGAEDRPRAVSGHDRRVQ